jgi:hypothetical protein
MLPWAQGSGTSARKKTALALPRHPFLASVMARLYLLDVQPDKACHAVGVVDDKADDKVYRILNSFTYDATE